MEEVFGGSLQVSFKQNVEKEQSVVDTMLFKPLSDYQEDLRVLL
jgi:hypothetical protein